MSHLTKKQSVVTHKYWSRYFPWELEKAIAEWVGHYNHERYHEPLDKVTPVDVYEARRNGILGQRAIIKSRRLSWRELHKLRLTV